MSGGVALLDWLMATLAAVEREADDFHDTSICDAYAPVYYCQGDCDCPVPAAVRASVEADRAILAEHVPSHELTHTPPYSDVAVPWRACKTCGDFPMTPWPCRTVLLVASRYAHRPGYLQEWKP